ncbi:MAG TPA: hypothetical protein VHT03_07780 [Rhizomicrobium sp.]|nr:hypothetical protein [Rhizomicrobium sp.]
MSRTGRWRAVWSAFSATVAGDIVATAIAIAGVSVLFIGGAFAALYLARAAVFVFSLLAP